MAKLAFVSKDFTEEILKQGTPDIIEIKAKSISIDVKIDVPDAVFKEVKYDATFIQNCHDRIKKEKLFETFVKNAAFRVRFYDTLCARAMISGNADEVPNHQKRFISAVDNDANEMRKGVIDAITP